MERKTNLRVRALARLVALVALAAPGALVFAMASACTELRGQLGADCLKSQDCLSGVCSGLHCVVSPPLLDVPYSPTDAGPDATLAADAAPAGDAVAADRTALVDDASQEASEPGPDAGTLPPDDAAADVVNDVHADAPTDGQTDAIADARASG